MKKITAISLGTALVITLSCLACRSQEQTVESDQEVLSLAPVKVFKVRKQSISEKLFYTGVIEAWHKIAITPEVGGKIARIHVEEGDAVKAGQLLAELDTRAIRLQLEQAEAAVAVAAANAKDAQRNRERMERLKKESAVSDQQYEKILLAAEAGEAQLLQAKAAKNLAQYSLDVSLMKAPFDGIVAARNVEVGDVINPMMAGYSPNSGVLTLMDFYQVKLELDVSHQDVVRIQKGLPVELRVASLPDRVFHGTVILVNVTADPQTKKFNVEAKFPNPDMTLRPNTFGEVTLMVKTRPDALVIPQQAVLDDAYVFVVGADNRAVRKDVTFGLQNDRLIEVVSGLEEGEMVIAEGNYGLESGAALEMEEVMP